MKLKYFLRGLGFGIVLTSLILFVFYRNNTPEQKNVVEQAKELGMVFPEGTAEPFVASRAAADAEAVTTEPADAKVSTAEPTDAKVSTAEPADAKVSTAESADDKVSTAEPTDKKADKDTAEETEPAETGSEKKTASPATQKPTADAAKTASSSKTKGTRFTVRSGLLSSTVAEEMKEAGIIKDDKALDDYLEKNGYATLVREGTYFIPEGASYKEIAKIITGK